MDELTAAQNIFIGREPRRGFGLSVDEARMNADAAALFRRMQVDIDPAGEVGTLTVARQQLVEIAKALSFDSKVLIMVEHLFAIIRDLRAQGVGIVYITHKMDEVKRVADRVTVMRDGRRIDTPPAAETPMATIVSMMVRLNRGAAVRDVGFAPHRGEILGFAGLMGAGRTEVARAVFGADPIDGGEIRVHGERRSIDSPRAAVANGIAYLGEDRKHFGLVTPMSVRDNISHRILVMCEGRITGELDGRTATQEEIMAWSTSCRRPPSTACSGSR